MTLLAIEELELSIGAVPVLHGVTLDVGAGEIVGVIGESGSGKSMTALAAMRLLPRGARARGRIRLAGHDMLALSERRLCRIRGREAGMVFQ
ncbi:MAG: ATP-binding cassette domain-containing protein, partial [Roseovarius sp.]|nr:ATP-binding cassette domain-containing protein [Roseovarius sp.]